MKVMPSNHSMYVVMLRASSKTLLGTVSLVPVEKNDCGPTNNSTITFF